MIAHVVLFRPKPSLSDQERATFVAALQHALHNIPLIKRARVGRRLELGRLYDEQNAEQFPFAAILEFDSAADLREYLNHPAHQALGEQFYSTSESALVFDFELIEGGGAGAWLQAPLLAKEEILERQDVQPRSIEDTDRIPR